MNVVLIGMRGSGKTTTGNILAQKLNRYLVETDELITKRAGLSIPDIVEKHGWANFRDIEEQIIAEVSGGDNVVLSAGGGVITRDRNTAGLKKNGVLVWLTAGSNTLLERIGQDAGRPPLVNGRTPREDMEITLSERRVLYEQAADIVVDTENKTPEDVAREIIDRLPHEENK
ncbi:shikimate kinase [Chloroflexota bacterium]